MSEARTTENGSKRSDAVARRGENEVDDEVDGEEEEL